MSEVEEVPYHDLWQEREDSRRNQLGLRARFAWYRYHTEQADRHRRTLEELVAYHEGEAAKLEEAGG